MTPFSRSITMMAAITAMMQQGIAMPAIAVSVGPYVSRGKGRGAPSRNFMRVLAAANTNPIKASRRSPAAPHVLTRRATHD